MAAAKYVQAVPFYPASPARYQSSHSHYTFEALRKFAQGAGSALLIFSGADSVAANPAGALKDASPIDISSLEGLLASIMNGPFSGHFQIAAAALLFLAAGRCIARFFGLAAAALLMFLYMQGVTVEDTWTFFNHFGQRVAAAAQAFQMVEVR